MSRVTFSLRQVLTIPYVLLTLAVAGIIGGFSYSAGNQAVSTVSEELLRDMVSRISQAVDRHLVGSRVVLDAVFPDGMKAPTSLDAEKENLRDRMWVAASLNPDPNNYVYYGNRDGRFAGVVRNPDGSGEWRSGQGSTTPRSMFRFAGLGAPLESPTLEMRRYDPRERPWYKKALEVKAPAWSPVYVDNRTGELVATRVKPIRNAKDEIEGVAATDVSLKALNEFVRALRVSENGVAFVAERNGDLIASSADDSTRLSNGQQMRMNASQSSSDLVRVAYQQFADSFGSNLKEPQAKVFDSPLGKTYASVFVIRDVAGLEWITVVAVPRSDFMVGVVKNVVRTASIAIVAALLAMFLGLWVLTGFRTTCDCFPLPHAAWAKAICTRRSVSPAKTNWASLPAILKRCISACRPTNSPTFSIAKRLISNCGGVSTNTSQGFGPCRSRCCLSISITSSKSTICSAIRLATMYWLRWPTG